MASNKQKTLITSVNTLKELYVRIRRKFISYDNNPKHLCVDCKYYYNSGCAYYPKEKWPLIWLTNQCGGFKKK